MTENFNYGPRMNFDQLHQRVHSTTIPSEYLDSRSGMHSQNPRPSDTLNSTSSVSSSLGTHWKRVNSGPMLDGAHFPICSSFSVPSKPATAPSSFSSYSSASSDSSNSSGHSSGNASVRASPRSSSETVTHVSDGSSSESQSFDMREPLTEKTDTREERQCLALQKRGIQELSKALERTTKNHMQSDRLMRQFFEEEHARSKHFIKKTRDFVIGLEDKFHSIIGGLEEKSENIHDQLSQIIEVFRKKAEIELFIREHESVYDANVKTANLLADNRRRVENIRKMLDFNRVEQFPLTVFEHEDSRVAEVFQSVVKMIRSLPLNENEKADMEHAIGKTEQNSQFSNKYKCETVIRHLLAIMSAWGGADRQSLIISNSEDWKSVDELNSIIQPANGSNLVESSSFALSDLQTEDSNLNDLDGELRSARIRRAVNEPIQIDSWPSASHFSRWSSVSDGRTDIQSLGEAMTLSSYELNSSDGQSTTSSVSMRSMPDQTFESSRNEALLVSPALRTALSQGDLVIPRSIRSGVGIADTEVINGTRTTPSNSVTSLNFSTVSLAEIVEDDLHTAKEAEETRASNLMEALHNSASKCGIAISDLMTAVSSSSESLSGTQTSQSITH